MALARRSYHACPCRPSYVLPLATSLSLWTSTTIHAAYYIVRPDGTGDFPTIQAAMDVCVDGDHIGLTDGVFTGVGNRDVDFQGKAVDVRSQSGDPAACIIDCELSGTGFRFETGEPSDASLNRLTIMNGICEEPPPACAGGAIRCTNGSTPVIWQCVISSNQAEQGAGVYCDNASPILRECTFSHNGDSSFLPAWEGAGIYCCNGSAPNIQDCTFTGNQAIATGGGICATDSSPHVQGCTFESNEADGGGAIWCLRSSPVIIECIFDGNMSDAGGGGAMACRSDVPGSSILTIIGCLLVGNRGTDGAGMLVSGSQAWLFACTFAAQDGDQQTSILYVGSGGHIELHRSIVAFSNGQAVVCGTGGHRDGRLHRCLRQLGRRLGRLHRRPVRDRRKLQRGPPVLQCRGRQLHAERGLAMCISARMRPDRRAADRLRPDGGGADDMGLDQGCLRPPSPIEAPPGT